jgi:hypothetical protein
MNGIDRVDLKQACRYFAVANTPLFLVRKLRSDPTVFDVSRSFSSEEIVGHIRDIMSRDPETVFDHAAPYAFLVALSLKPDDRGLKLTMTVPVSEKWGWFGYIRDVLLETYIPVAQSSIWVPGQVVVRRVPQSQPSNATPRPIVVTE